MFGNGRTDRQTDGQTDTWQNLGHLPKVFPVWNWEHTKNCDWVLTETNPKKSTFSFPELDLAQLHIFSKLWKTTHFHLLTFLLLLATTVWHGHNSIPVFAGQRWNEFTVTPIRDLSASGARMRWYCAAKLDWRWIEVRRTDTCRSLVTFPICFEF